MRDYAIKPQPNSTLSEKILELHFDDLTNKNKALTLLENKFLRYSYSEDDVRIIVSAKDP